jgi:hypothetical protein
VWTWWPTRATRSTPVPTQPSQRRTPTNILNSAYRKINSVRGRPWLNPASPPDPAPTHGGPPCRADPPSWADDPAVFHAAVWRPVSAPAAVTTRPPARASVLTASRVVHPQEINSTHQMRRCYLPLATAHQRSSSSAGVRTGQTATAAVECAPVSGDSSKETLSHHVSAGQRHDHGKPLRHRIAADAGAGWGESRRRAGLADAAEGSTCSARLRVSARPRCGCGRRW